MGVNPTFGVNYFNRPKVLSEMETYATDALVLLLGRPGFYPSIPSIGMDIRQYLYKFTDDINEKMIKTQLAEQCSDFIPEIQSGDLDVVKTQYNGNTMLIFVLPIINDTKQLTCAIGVTTNARGDIVYNFVESKNQIIS